MFNLKPKLSSSETTIFTRMSALATEYGAVNLGQGFPDFDPPADLLDHVRQSASGHTHQYAPMPGLLRLREAIARKAGALYNIDLDPHTEVTITAGATQALFTAIMTLVHPGDEVIIFEPAYDSYRPSVELAGGRTVVYRMQPPDFRINWQMVAGLVTGKTRMIIINSPHNPTGKVLAKADLESLSSLVSNTEILVLSDEVYEHLVYDGHCHESVLRYPELFARSIAVFSFGKTYHCTGWKIGYLVAPVWLTAEIRKVHQWNVFSVNSVLQHALAEYTDNSHHYHALAGFYQAKRDLFRQMLAGTGFRLLACEGTFFQLCSYDDISQSDDDQFTLELVRKHKVAAIPLSAFYSEPGGVRLVRFCFAKKEETLLLAGDRLRSVV